MGLLLFFACKKEPDLISGKISGYINYVDAGYNLSHTLTGINMTLSQGDKIIGYDTTLDNSFVFENVPYGKYLLTASKEGCLPATQGIEHIGGYSPTLSVLWIYQIPSYSLVIDSVVIIPETGQSSAWLYGQLDNYSLNAYIGIIFLCLTNTTPDVDADHYIQKMVAFATSGDISDNHVKARINNDYGFQAEPGDTLYMRAYPMSWGENLYTFHKQYLGTPSNVTRLTIRF